VRRGHLIAVPPPDESLEFLAADDRTHGQPHPERRAATGSAATARAELEDVVARYGAEEAIIVTITYEHEARRRSYELLADAFLL
jgi:alkanesulfonate monooxygenase SsuD/methylene tetrahydromethanopterin reductase-like flavin-dependent oxidoreductase (luciferase family)